jgi:hypothetical protein
MKKRIIRLAPNVPSWCDIKNNIYLTRPQKPFRSLPDDIDMTNINKGIKAGLIRIDDLEIPDIKPIPEVKVEVKIVEPEVKEEIIEVEQPKPKRARKKKVVEDIKEEIVEEKIDDKEE